MAVASSEVVESREAVVVEGMAVSLGEVRTVEEVMEVLAGAAMVAAMEVVVVEEAVAVVKEGVVMEVMMVVVGLVGKRAEGMVEAETGAWTAVALSAGVLEAVRAEVERAELLPSS